MENELKKVQAQREQEQQKQKFYKLTMNVLYGNGLLNLIIKAKELNSIYNIYKGYWETVIHEQLATRIEEITNIEQQINQLPLQRSKSL